MKLRIKDESEFRKKFQFLFSELYYFSFSLLHAHQYYFYFIQPNILSAISYLILVFNTLFYILKNLTKINIPKIKFKK